jgi:hypothetical protein
MPLKHSLVPDRDTIRGMNHPLSFDTRVGAIARDPASSFGWLALRGQYRTGTVTFEIDDKSIRCNCLGLKVW